MNQLPVIFEPVLRRRVTLCARHRDVLGSSRKRLHRHRRRTGNSRRRSAAILRRSRRRYSRSTEVPDHRCSPRSAQWSLRRLPMSLCSGPPRAGRYTHRADEAAHVEQFLGHRPQGQQPAVLEAGRTACPAVPGWRSYCGSAHSVVAVGRQHRRPAAHRRRSRFATRTPMVQALVLQLHCVSARPQGSPRRSLPMRIDLRHGVAPLQYDMTDPRLTSHGARPSPWRKQAPAGKTVSVLKVSDVGTILSLFVTSSELVDDRDARWKRCVRRREQQAVDTAEAAAALDSALKRPVLLPAYRP